MPLFNNLTITNNYGTSAEGGNVFTSVSLSVRRVTEKVVNGFDEISWRGRASPRDQ